MLTIINYIKSFLSRSGSYVFGATILARLFSFIASWIALKLIDNEELGVVLFAYNIIIFLIPIAGFGLHQSLIRYGAILTSKEEKNDLFVYVFNKGILASLILICLIIVSCFFINFTFKNTYYYIIILSFVIIPSFIFEILRAQFRIQHKNKSFAYTEFVHSIILLLSIFVLSLLFKELGYAIALLITPLLTSFLFFKSLKIDFSSHKKLPVVNLSFWRYGFFASLSNVVTQLLFAIDILLIGYLIQDTEMVTNYRYISLIPFSLLFLPRVFMATDFVTFTEKIEDKKYILNYIKSYTLFFLGISIFVLLLSFYFGKYALYYLDQSFVVFFKTFFILIVGITGIYILRGLYGNLLSSIGKAHVNYYISSIALILNIAFNFYLIPKYGLNGAAITSAVLMWFTGMLSMACFWKLYKK